MKSDIKMIWIMYQIIFSVLLTGLCSKGQNLISICNLFWKRNQDY